MSDGRFAALLLVSFVVEAFGPLLLLAAMLAPDGDIFGSVVLAASASFLAEVAVELGRERNAEARRRGLDS